MPGIGQTNEIQISLGVTTLEHNPRDLRCFVISAGQSFA